MRVVKNTENPAFRPSSSATPDPLPHGQHSERTGCPSSRRSVPRRRPVLRAHGCGGPLLLSSVTQSIRGKSRHKRFQHGDIPRRLKESTGLRRFLRHEALHGGDQIRGRDECPAVQEGALFKAGQAPDFGEVDRVERVCPRSGDVEALTGGFQCGGRLLVPVVAVHPGPIPDRRKRRGGGRSARPRP